MNPIHIIDYLYYRINWWNTHVIKDNEFKVITNSIGVSALIGLNIISIILIIISFNHLRIELIDNKIYRNIIITILLLVVYSYFKFFNNHAKIINRYDSYGIGKKRPMDRVLITYIAATISLLIGAIIYGRSHHTG